MYTPGLQWEPARARELAILAADRFGFSRRAAPLRLLRFGSNALYLDQTSGAVLRVGPPGTNRSNGVKVARILAKMGLPVLAPLDDLDTVEINGHQISAWPYIADSGNQPCYRELGELVYSIHNATPILLADTGLALLSGNTLRHEQLDKIQRRLHQLKQGKEASPPDLDLLQSCYNKLAQEFDGMNWQAASVLHADVHPGNVLVGVDHQYLIDFDHVCVGPRVWDHVPILVQTERFGLDPSSYQQYAKGYGEDVRDDPGLRILRDMRCLAATTWAGLLNHNRAGARDEYATRMRYWRTGSQAVWTAL